jgi:HEAT repeat protein
VEKTFPVSGDCELDGGGLPFIQLTGVRPPESVALLTSLVTERKDQALSAIAMHGDASAVTALLDLAKNDKSPAIRGKALFWVAQRAGQRETAAIVSSLDNDPDLEVKKKAAFSLTQIPKNEGVPKLIEVARANRSPEVRKQAMFWLGQSKDPRALQFFQDVLTK